MRAIPLLITLICLSWSAHATPPSVYWPLDKGTFWIYEGDVSWVEANAQTGQNEIRQKHLTWRSEVTDCIDVNGVTVALVHGSPLDLAWYNSKKQPSDTLLIGVGPDYYRVTKNAVATFAHIKAAGDYLPTADPNAPGETAEILINGPLAPGKKFGIDGDSLYGLFRDRCCEMVDGPVPFDLRPVRGAPRIVHAQVYSITCQTSPDNDEIDFAPGLGITAYTYNHHGTTMKVEVALKEFGVAKN